MKRFFKKVWVHRYVMFSVHHEKKYEWRMRFAGSVPKPLPFT